jgi:hypothetical protein
MCGSCVETPDASLTGATVPGPAAGWALFQQKLRKIEYDGRGGGRFRSAEWRPPAIQSAAAYGDNLVCHRRSMRRRLCRQHVIVGESHCSYESRHSCCRKHLQEVRPFLHILCHDTDLGRACNRCSVRELSPATTRAVIHLKGLGDDISDNDMWDSPVCPGLLDDRVCSRAEVSVISRPKSVTSRSRFPQEFLTMYRRSNLGLVDFRAWGAGVTPW